MTKTGLHCTKARYRRTIDKKKKKPSLSDKRLNHYEECSFDLQKKFRIAKSVGSCQRARYAQADMGQYLSRIH